MKKLLPYLLLLAMVPAHAQITDATIKEFDAYVERSRNLFQIPGLAVTVVKDGKVLLKKGYGVRQSGLPQPVDAQTLYACASTTKAMTATCMAILVDEGKVKWDDPVINYLPDFQLYDPFVTRELKIRDLFTHNSGVGNADFLWSFMQIPAEQVVGKMKLVKPSYSTRSSFIYQNIFYVVAGKVIEKVSGQPWETFIRKRIFEPLQMTRTFPLLSQVKDPNQSQPHYFYDNSIQVIQRTSADAVGPAGSVWSCVEDMSKWALCMLDSSKYAGGRLIKPTTWMELFKPQVMVTAAQFYPTAKLTKPNWTTYSLGWFQQDYQGRKINYHTGSLAGETAMHAQLPSERLAIYIFGNLDHAELRHALLFKAFDHFALGGSRDWSAEVFDLYKKQTETSEQQVKKFESERIPNTKPTLDLASYAGTYSDPLYGELTVAVQGSSLMVSLNNVAKATLEHWHYDTFRGFFEKRWWGKTNATFAFSSQGKIASVTFAGMEFRKK
ncbi:MAG: serine hydrolase [Cyclobacteriaceae bacterium]|nr:serine hydrolase [Cyclobacteriaceae bacterium]